MAKSPQISPNFSKISQNFSTWQFFLHKYNLWHLWQIWALRFWYLIISWISLLVCDGLTQRTISYYPHRDFCAQIFVNNEAFSAALPDSLKQFHCSHNYKKRVSQPLIFPSIPIKNLTPITAFEKGITKELDATK